MCWAGMKIKHEFTINQASPLLLFVELNDYSQELTTALCAVTAQIKQLLKYPFQYLEVKPYV